MFSVLGLGLAAGALSAGLPYYDIPTIHLWKLPLQPFGIVVAIGVLIGASVMRRYAEKHGCDDDDLRGLTGWVTVCGFIGAHVFDVLAYQPEALAQDPLLILKLWQGISSYGGFLGGAAGFAFYVWWKRLTPGMWADATAVGLLVAFSIGRIGCTIVHDHIGHQTDFWLAFDYPRKALADRHILTDFTSAAPVIRAWNLGLLELLYLVPVNAVVLFFAFRGRARAAGFLAVLAGALYAPVRFGLEFLRLGDSDPRYVGLTFAQWCSIAAFGVAAYVGARLLKRGVPAPLRAELDGRPGGRIATMQTMAAQEGRKPAKPEKPTVEGKPSAARRDEARATAENAETAEKAKHPAAADEAADDEADEGTDDEGAADEGAADDEAAAVGAPVAAGAGGGSIRAGGGGGDGGRGGGGKAGNAGKPGKGKKKGKRR